MASGSRLCHSSHINLFINPADDEIAGDFLEALIKSNSFPALTFWTSSYRSILSLIFILIFASVIGRYMNKNLKRATQFALKLFFQG